MPEAPAFSWPRAGSDHRAPVLAGTPLGVLSVVGAGLVICRGLAAAGVIPEAAGRVAAVAAIQAALLATALAWAGQDAGPGGQRPAIVGAAIVTLAVSTGAIHRLGAVAYAGPIALVVGLARRGRLRALGLGGPVSRSALLAGVSIGVVLGAHLLLSARLTTGYRPGLPDPGRWLAALAYDAGGNVLGAECFFRGALFNRLQRRWSFGGGAAVSTAAAAVRYLVDPLLPTTVEMAFGAVFYTGLLGLAGCWLLWWSGSLLPGLTCGLLFFASYRLVAP
jgi:hypothetical protein